MNGIEHRLLSLLLEEEGPVNSSYLASFFGLSSKTVQTHIKRLTDDLPKYGAKIISKTGSGYSLQITDQNAFEHVYRDLDKSQENTSILTINEIRAHAIVRLFLANYKYVQIENIEDLLFLNRTSAISILNQAKKVLESFDLSIKTYVNKGMKIEGTEANIRACICYETNFYAHSPLGIVEPFEKEYIPKDQDRKLLLDLVLADIKSYSPNELSDRDVQGLVESLYIAIRRDNKGCNLKYDEEVLDRFLGRDSYYTAKTICDKCSKKFNVSLTDEDLIYITIYIVANRAVIDKSFYSTRQEWYSCREMAFQIVRELEETNKFDYLSKDVELIEDLAMCLTQITNRMEFNLKTSYHYFGVTLGLMAKQWPYKQRAS